VRVSRLRNRDDAAGSSAPLPEDAGRGPSDAPEAKRLRLVRDDAYASWEAVYADNVTRIYRLMFSRVTNRPDAEDLTSQVFMTALPSLRLTATRPEVRAYLAATARTVLAGHWRRTFGLEITAIDPADVEAILADPEPEPPAAGRERMEAILSQLPSRYRAVLELRFLRSYSMREVASELGVSVSNAGVIQHRALRLAAGIAGQDTAGESGQAGKDTS
jgi:RNA polymerase sigma factor (sigma-70 family)